jgi:hypothetical protein
MLRPDHPPCPILHLPYSAPALFYTLTLRSPCPSTHPDPPEPACAATVSPPPPPPPTSPPPLPCSATAQPELLLNKILLEPPCSLYCTHTHVHTRTPRARVHTHTHTHTHTRHTRANETGSGDDLSASFYDEQLLAWCRFFPRQQVVTVACICVCVCARASVFVHTSESVTSEHFGSRLKQMVIDRH